MKGNLVTMRYSYDLKPDKRAASYLQYIMPTPYNSMEAYLLLEAAWCKVAPESWVIGGSKVVSSKGVRRV